jgi:IclR family transcriptional regulator, KDG regulon repressor
MNTIERALDIFEAILNNKGEITLIDLAKATGQSISTTHRICSVLIKKRYLYQQRERGKYSLGYKFLLFNDIANTSSNIKTEAMPFLKDLSEKISETVILSVYDGIEPVDIASVVPDLILKAVPGLNQMSPCHCTAVGKVFLAHMPDEMIEKILSSLEFKVYTERTITDVNRLKAELRTIVKEGIAYDDEEFLIGLRSAAAPVRGESGEVFACVSYLAPSTRVSSLKMKQFTPLVKACALSVSKALGYQDKGANRQRRVSQIQR